MHSLFDLNLSSLIGQFFGESDDYLGSYERTWDKSSNWGKEIYIDVPCYMEDGSIGLRLWFTICDSPYTTIKEENTPTDDDYESTILTQANISLTQYDEKAYKQQYGNTPPSQYPFSEYGVHFSKLIHLNASGGAILTIQSKEHICLQNGNSECNEGIGLILWRKISTTQASALPVIILASDVDISSDSNITRLAFEVSETGDYQLVFINREEHKVNVTYVISQ